MSNNDNDDFVSKKKRREAQVKAQVRDLLREHKWKFRMPASNAFGRSGLSDFIAFKSGVFMAIETKSNGNTLTQLQRDFLVEVNSEQGFGFTVDEARLAVLDEFLKRFDRASVDAIKRKIMSEDGARMLDCIAAMTRELR